MKKKYKLKKKYSISVAVIIIVAVATMFAMNIGYSLLGSKLNIYGKVNLKAKSDKLEVIALPKGEKVYTNITGIYNKELEFVSDEYVDNTLTTTLRKGNNASSTQYCNINVAYTLKNNSSQRKDF